MEESRGAATDEKGAVTMDVSVHDKVAVVTRASRGIGLATALELTRSGAKGVVITSRKAENINSARDELLAAVSAAEHWLLGPLEAATSLGAGSGPIHHFHRQWSGT